MDKSMPTKSKKEYQESKKPSALRDAKHERFAVMLVGGMKPAEAYKALGHKVSGHSATVLAYRMVRKPEVQAKVTELRKAATSLALEHTAVDRAFVLDGLKANFLRAMQAVPVLDAQGRPTGQYTWAGSVANRALELMGKELGMFADKSEANHTVKITKPEDIPDDVLDAMIEEFKQKVEADSRASGRVIDMDRADAADTEVVAEDDASQPFH